MTDRSAPARILGPQIAELEAEIQAALKACPLRQRFEIEALRRRLARLKDDAALAALEHREPAPLRSVEPAGRGPAGAAPDGRAAIR